MLYPSDKNNLYVGVGGEPYSFAKDRDPLSVNTHDVISEFNKIIQYHFHDTGDTSPIKSHCYIGDNDKLKYNGGNIAPFIRRLYLKNRGSYDMIVKTIKLAVPDFYDFYIKENVESDEKITLEWIHKDDKDTPRHPSWLSDGSLRFICLVTVLLQPVKFMPDIVIIDEPELGLHPEALLIFANLVERISLQKQFIIATQSSALIDLFAAEDIVVVGKNNDGTSSFARLDQNELSEWLKEYNVSELWDKNIIGGRP
jgi:predicted ATPase